MQDAYFVDQQSIGTWTQIGYESPTSKNFAYDASNGYEWYANASFDLPDGCTNGWYVDVDEITVDNVKTVKYQASDNCSPLTPNFKNIGTSS
ncbi:hypothetical protein SAMN05720471_10644 [Fibrobacter sp. UWP2]|nr:hypothetical protein SAMN05720471_10644 [Fibrobacter sp. UWP2]